MLKSVIASLRSNLVAGIVVTIPVALSVWVVFAFHRLVDKPLRASLADVFGEKYFLEVPGVGIVFVLAVIFLVGFITRTFIGGLFVRIGEWIFGHIPVVRTLYLGSKQLLSALLGGSEVSFREVVLVEYPKKHSYVLGFVSSRGKGQLATINMEPILNVFIPTTPNPTSGYLVLIPESRVKRLDMSVEDAVKFIISSGIVANERESEMPTLFETPTTKVPLEQPPEGVHPDIQRLTDLIEKEKADFHHKDNEEED